MDHTQLYGAWLRDRRKTLALSKDALGQRVGCSGATIAKIEAGLRRPSQQIATRLAHALEIATTDHEAFVRWARQVPDVLPSMVEAPSSPRYNLPMPITPLVGRESEVQHIARQLQQRHVRLLTLSGPPGVGKTRVGLGIAHHAASAFRDGVAFVSLAAVHNPNHVLHAIIGVFNIQDQASMPLFEQLVMALHKQEMLLVLDNFEHVVESAPQLVGLLEACPYLTVLATSRQRLHVRGEHHVRIAPLPLPAAQSDALRIAQSPAVQLFTQVAQAANSAFLLHKENAQTIATICARLDGLPLAIEVVAAHADTFSSSALLAQLEQHMLAKGPRDLPERQQTLRAALDWSYGLLSQAEQQLFRRLGVFVGAWSVDMAAHVCSNHETSQVADLLVALAHKSMVQHAATPTNEPCFTMLETIRTYSAERLHHSGEAEEIGARHAHAYCQFAIETAHQLTNNGQQQSAAQLRHERANLQAAFDWFLARGNVEQAGTMCRALRRFWWMSGSFREGREWVARVLIQQHLLSPITQTYMFITDGMLAAAQGNPFEGIAAFETALDLAHNTEDEEAIGVAVHNLGNLLVGQGQNERGRACLEVGLAIDRTSGDQWGLAVSLGSLGELCYNEGDYIAAWAYFSESLALYRAHGDNNSVVIMLNNLGEVARLQHNRDTAKLLLEQGLLAARNHEQQRMLPFLLNNLSMLALETSDTAQARQLLREALHVLEATGGAHVLATSFVIAALLAHHEEQASRATTLLGAAYALRAAQNIRLSLAEQAEFDQLTEMLHTALAPEAFQHAWLCGQHLDTTAALQLALTT